MGTIVGGHNNKDYIIFGSILGSPLLLETAIYVYIHTHTSHFVYLHNHWPDQPPCC